MCLLITPSIDTARMALLFECREFYCAAGPVRADVFTRRRRSTGGGGMSSAGRGRARLFPSTMVK
jgi:hypothetical protein